MEITLTISKSAVMAEVAQKSAYVGAKMEGETDQYDHIATVDEDVDELTHMWNELRSFLTERFMSKLSSEGFDEDDTDSYELVLNVHDTFNTALTESMQYSLFYYFVYGILWKWFMYTNKEESEAYHVQSQDALDGLWGKCIRRTFERGQRPF